MHDALHGLAQNPALPPELLDRLVADAVADADADGELAAALARRPDLGRAHVAALMRSAPIELAHAGRLAAEDVDVVEPDLRASVIVAMLHAGHGRPEWARRLAAAHPALPAAITVELLDDPDWQTAQAAGANPALPREAMAALLA